MALSEQALPESILRPLCQTCIPIQDLYDQAVQALLSKDISLANRVLDSKLAVENLWKLCTEADEHSKISCLALSHTYLLVDNLKQVTRYACEIAEIAIDQAEAGMKSSLTR